MDILWNPWRYNYIKSDKTQKQADSTGCVFCDILKNPATDEEKYIVHRAGFNFVILNVYPYAAGHLMIVPFEHLADINRADKKITDEMMDLAKRYYEVLQEVYKPDGINLGMNFGRAAGAGVAEHFHMHILPRWVGDANFMTPIGETRMIPEDLKTTYEKLKGKI